MLGEKQGEEVRMCERFKHFYAFRINHHIPVPWSSLK